METRAEKTNDFIIEPVVDNYGRALYLTFRAGIDKLYVVKNLTELVRCYERQESMRFGTKTEIHFAKHRISPTSKEIFEYLCRVVREEQSRIEHMRASSRYYYADDTIRNEIQLYGERLDRFYELYEGKSVASNDKRVSKAVKTRLYLKEGKPNIQMEIEKDMDEEGVFMAYLLQDECLILLRVVNIIIMFLRIHCVAFTRKPWQRYSRY